MDCYFEMLVENPQLFPDELVSIIDEMGEKSASDGLSLSDCQTYLERCEGIGWTFEYGMDAEPYDLQKLDETFQQFMARYTKETNGYFYGYDMISGKERLSNPEKADTFWIADQDFNLIFECEAFDEVGNQRSEVKEAMDKYEIHPENGLDCLLISFSELPQRIKDLWEIDKTLTPEKQASLIDYMRNRRKSK
jgi:hypothetical protein